MEFKPFARRRMARYGLTEDHIRLVVQGEPSYRTHGADVYQRELPDGRTVKVQMAGDTVNDAFVPG